MNRNSLPPGNRDEATETTTETAALRAELRAHMQTHGLSNPAIGRELGYGATVVSQWLNDKYPGDAAEVTSRVRDYLRSFRRRRVDAVPTVDCDVAQQVGAAIEAIRRTNDVGVILAEAGQGKTRAVELFCEQNKTAVLFRVRSWNADKQSIEGALMEAAGRGGYDHRTRRAVWLCEKFAGSGRPLIVDDAHKLTRPALQWFFDFHDETGCPIPLIGTYELLDKLKDDAQRFSRVGLLHEVKPAKPRTLIDHLIGRLLPHVPADEAEELAVLCEQVAEKHGHFRAVFKQLRMTAEIRAGAPATGWSACFRAAHKKLVREYPLS